MNKENKVVEVVNMENLEANVIVVNEVTTAPMQNPITPAINDSYVEAQAINGSNLPERNKDLVAQDTLDTTNQTVVNNDGLNEELVDSALEEGEIQDQVSNGDRLHGVGIGLSVNPFHALANIGNLDEPPQPTYGSYP